jgi:hypothetical protein
MSHGYEADSVTPRVEFILPTAALRSTNDTTALDCNSSIKFVVINGE